MEDRFKFRVWDKDNKSYVKWDNCCYHTNMPMLDCTGELFISNGKEIPDDTYDDPDYDFSVVHELEEVEDKYNPSKDNYIIEQCTGLKDENGDLIYEGDIVKIPVFIHDYQSSHPGMIDFYMDDFFYKECKVVFKDYKYCLEYLIPIKYESGHIEKYTSLNLKEADFLDHCNTFIEEELKKGYVSEEIMGVFMDNQDIFDSILDGTFDYKLEIIGNIHTNKEGE